MKMKLILRAMNTFQILFFLVRRVKVAYIYLKGNAFDWMISLTDDAFWPFVLCAVNLAIERDITNVLTA